VTGGLQRALRSLAADEPVTSYETTCLGGDVEALDDPAETDEGDDVDAVLDSITQEVAAELVFGASAAPPSLQLMCSFLESPQDWSACDRAGPRDAAALAAMRLHKPCAAPSGTDEGLSNVRACADKAAARLVQ
jgi:hypothetical protein